MYCICMYFEQLSISTVSMYVPGNGGGDGPRVRSCIRAGALGIHVLYHRTLPQTHSGVRCSLPLSFSIHLMYTNSSSFGSKQIYIHT